MWRQESVLFPRLRRLSAGFGEGGLRSALARSNDEPIPAAITLSIVIPDGRLAAREADLARLLREVALLAHQIDRDREVVELVVDASALAMVPQTFPWPELLPAIEHLYHLATHAARTVLIGSGAIEGDTIAALKAAGFDHLALAAGRAQMRAVTIAHRCGFRCVAVRLDTDGEDVSPHAALSAALEVRPERIEIRATDGFLPGALEVHGYTYIGPGQFALDGDELTLAFRTGSLRLAPFGYTATGECDVVGVGPGAISEIGDCVVRNAPGLEAWRGAIDNGRLPAMEGIVLGRDDRLRAAVMEGLLCRRAIPVRALEAAFGLDFRAHFSTELTRLKALPWSRHLRDSGERIEVLSPGWPWLRTMAQCFIARSSRLH